MQQIYRIKVMAICLGLSLFGWNSLSSARVIDAEPRNDSSTEASTLVKLKAGKLSGSVEEGLKIYKGIPYAAPPTADLRWMPPKPVAGWNEIKTATDFGPACIQPQYPAGVIYDYGLTNQSEDCLTLNIWAPQQSEHAPVFVWIHGGSLIRGSASEPMYDGKALAKQGMVVVSLNYRLGVMGYFAHPLLSKASADGVSGNYGMLDQLAALSWVQDNIQAFGGDPQNVTVAGESAGALSILYLMSTDKSQGLFHKAIVQSANMSTTRGLNQEVHGLPSAESLGLQITHKLKAVTLDEIKALNPHLVSNTALELGINFRGTIDGSLLTKQLVDTFRANEQAKVPLMVGFNSGEMSSLTSLVATVPQDSKQYIESIQSKYNDLSADFLSLYPSTNLKTSTYNAVRDGLFGWTSVLMARQQAQLGQPTYLYYFDHGYDAANQRGLHAFHASELPYLFSTFSQTPILWPAIPNTDAEQQLSQAMRNYWVNFAKHGKPTATGYPDWPSYQKGKSYMWFNRKPTPATHLLPGMFELHDRAVCRRQKAKDVPWNWNVGIASPVLQKFDCL
ncbi:carboxylesterase family protein [Shewanella sp. A25]|nr:carboxylesterase family protein [Shewanella shenzhenensis]